MELSFALVLALGTLVTATPHGYRVEGGASAKAEASASAGAFGDVGPIPLSIPSGAAYSGSFSKSSSSSFASSSASSSSSSYSFSGSGATGVTGIGSQGSGQKECSSGTCPEIGSAGPSLNGVQQLGGANAVAAAQAKALSYTPCQGTKCNESPLEKCSLGQCSGDTELKTKNKCSTGNCESKSEPESLSNDASKSLQCSSGQCDTGKEGDNTDTNDFAININRDSQSKSSHVISGQYPKKGQASETDCSSGKCIPHNSYSNNAGTNPNQQSVPATYLTTPNKNGPCTTPACNSPSQGYSPQASGLPSSYNVPIQSATNSPNTYYSPSVNNFQQGNQANPHKENKDESGIPCTSPNCASASPNDGTYNTPNNFGPQEHSNQGPCISGRCDSFPNERPSDNGPLPGINSPNYSQGHYPSHVPLGHSEQSGCTTSNCAGFSTNKPNFGSSTEPKYTIPAYSTAPTNHQLNNCGTTSCAGITPPASPIKPNNSNGAVYAGGFGGSTGVQDITSDVNKLPGQSGNNYGNLNHQPSASRPTETFGHTPVHGSYETKPSVLRPVNHDGVTHTPSSIGLTGPDGYSNVQKPFGTTKPNELSYNHYAAAHTPSSGVTTGTFDYNKPSSVPSTPSSQFNPSYSGSFATPTASSVPIGSGTFYGNTGAGVPSSTVQSTDSPAFVNTAAGSTVPSHLTSGSNSIQGSYGESKPSTASNILSSPTYTNGFGGPIGSVHGSSPTFGISGKPSLENCGVAGCNGQAKEKIKPTTTTATQSKPSYTGGFGGPTGFLKPNDFNVPNHNPAPSSGSSACVTGTCVPKSPSESYNYGHALSSAHSLAAATASANAVVYSGGFGGPPGVLKPYDDGKGNIPVHRNPGSIHSSPVHNNANSGELTGNGKNFIPSGSPNGFNAGAHASASATATAGSFDGNNSYRNIHGGSGGCNSGCPTYGSNNDAVNFGLPVEPLKNGLGAGSSASAKSIAGANSFGFRGSYANSSASAHASAGAPTKGGYGRK